MSATMSRQATMETWVYPLCPQFCAESTATPLTIQWITPPDDFDEIPIQRRAAAAEGTGRAFKGWRKALPG